MHLPQAIRAGASEARARQTIAEYLRGLRDGSEEEQDAPCGTQRALRVSCWIFWKASLDGPIMLMWGNAFASGSEPERQERHSGSAHRRIATASMVRVRALQVFNRKFMQVMKQHWGKLGRVSESLWPSATDPAWLTGRTARPGGPGDEAAAVGCPMHTAQPKSPKSCPSDVFDIRFMDDTAEWPHSCSQDVVYPHLAASSDQDSGFGSPCSSMLWMPGQHHFAPAIWCDCGKAGICRLWRRFGQWQAQGFLRAVRTSAKCLGGPSLAQAYPLGCWELHLNPIHGGEQAALKAIKARGARHRSLRTFRSLPVL